MVLNDGVSAILFVDCIMQARLSEATVQLFIEPDEIEQFVSTVSVFELQLEA